MVLSGLPDVGNYAVVYADPPWNFKCYSTKGSSKSPAHHYDCMDLAAICDLPIKPLTAKSSVLLMWTTGPFLEKSMSVITSWGFKYKTVGFCWAKKNRHSDRFFKGMGYWTRANAEYCLLATKGSPKRISFDVESLVVSARREHSRKPDEMYSRIETLLPGPYLELFARNERNGWDSWGNQPQTFQAPLL
jgi:N6-adenosine-specific RNA methylase IME4